MENPRLKILFAVIACAILVSGSMLALTIWQVNKVTAESLRNDGFFVYDAPITLNDFNLADHRGAPFTPENLQDKWTLVFFGYTFCPDICPITLASIKQFYDLLGESSNAENVQVIMVSVDPERDTTEVLENYVTFFNPEFIGVRGDYTQVYTLARNMNVSFSYTRIDDDNYLVNHNGEIMLLNPEGKNVGFFKAPHAPQAMLDNFLAVKKLPSAKVVVRESD